MLNEDMIEFIEALSEDYEFEFETIEAWYELIRNRKCIKEDHMCEKDCLERICKIKDDSRSDIKKQHECGIKVDYNDYEKTTSFAVNYALYSVYGKSSLTSLDEDFLKYLGVRYLRISSEIQEEAKTDKQVSQLLLKFQYDGKIDQDDLD